MIGGFKLFLRFFPLIGVFLSLSCISSHGGDILVHPHPEDDSTYFTEYSKATSHHEVVNNFETRFIVQSTILSTPFRKAFAKRYQDLYFEKEPVLTEASQRTGFFVSIYTADPELNDISDANLWTIKLKKGTSHLKPVKIEKLRQKERWRPFFKGISPWSVEYLVLFDAPASLTDKSLVQVDETQLVLSNQDGRVTIGL